MAWFVSAVTWTPLGHPDGVDRDQGASDQVYGTMVQPPRPERSERCSAWVNR